MVLGCREQEPAGREGLQQVEQFIGSHHGQALQVWRNLRWRRNIKQVVLQLLQQKFQHKRSPARKMPIKQLTIYNYGK